MPSNTQEELASCASNVPTHVYEWRSSMVTPRNQIVRKPGQTTKAGAA